MTIQEPGVEQIQSHTPILDKFNQILLILYFSMLTLIVAYVSVRLRFRLDFPAIVISVGQIVSYLIRLPIIEQSVYTEFIPVLSQMCVGGSMYFFILVMKRFKD